MNPSSTPPQSRTQDTPEDMQRRHMDKVAEAGTDAAGRGAGLPAQAPQTERKPTDSPWTPKEASIKSRMRLPHERDEDAAMTGAGDGGTASSPQVEQAAADLAAGRKDTSRASETDQAYHRLHTGASQTPGKPGQDR